jgi:AraC family multidrug resistance transcriptional activator
MQETVVSALQGWIEENIENPLTIKDVAKKSGYSQWYLQRMFYAVTKRHLGGYIRDRKLEKAAYDLTHTNDSVTNISYKYGYSSPNSFSRIFITKYQLQPSKYRSINKTLF